MGWALSWDRPDARVDGHWNWVGERSFAWIRRNVEAFSPAELIVGYLAVLKGDPEDAE